MGNIRITEIRKGDIFYENDIHTSIEMLALEDVKLVTIEGWPDDEKYSVKVNTADGDIEIGVNKEFVDSYLALNLTREPEYMNIIRRK